MTLPKDTLHRNRILYVEDNDDHRYVITLSLERSEYEVVAVATCAQAVAQARQRKFDIFLLDNGLPDGEGACLCFELRQLSPQTPVIFFTTAPDAEAKVAALESGACAYLTKPLDGYTLTQEIEHVLRRATHSLRD